MCKASGRESSGIDLRAVLLNEDGGELDSSPGWYGHQGTSGAYELHAQARFIVDGAAAQVACQGRWSQIFFYAEVVAIVIQ